MISSFVGMSKSAFDDPGGTRSGALCIAVKSADICRTVAHMDVISCDLLT
jgi:hypothetical protein